MMERGACSEKSRSRISIDQQPFHHCPRIPHYIDPISVDDEWPGTGRAANDRWDSYLPRWVRINLEPGHSAVPFCFWVMRPVCNCSFILYFQQDVKFDGLCRGYCFWKIKCKKMLLVRRGLRKDSWHASILYQERTVDTPQSYIRRGQWTHLNHMSGEDSGHTSILCQERTVNTPQSWPGEDTYLHIRRGHTSILWERNISIPNNGPSGVQDSKPPSLQGTLKVRGKDGDDFEVWRKFVGNKPTRRNVNKLKGVSVVE